MLGEEWKSAEFRERYPPEGGILMNMLLIMPSFQMRSKRHCVHIMKIMNAVHSYSNPSPSSVLSPSLKMCLSVEIHYTVPTIAKFIGQVESEYTGNIFLICALLIGAQISQRILKCFI